MLTLFWGSAQDCASLWVQLSCGPRQGRVSHIHVFVSGCAQPSLISIGTKVAWNPALHFILFLKNPKRPDLYPALLRADSRLVPSQWETSLQSNGISHWLGVNLESARTSYCDTLCNRSPHTTTGTFKICFFVVPKWSMHTVWSWLRWITWLLQCQHDSSVTGISVYGSSQWQMALKCNTVSHWLGAYTESSLCVTRLYTIWCTLPILL